MTEINSTRVKRESPYGARDLGHAHFPFRLVTFCYIDSKVPSSHVAALRAGLDIYYPDPRKSGE